MKPLLAALLTVPLLMFSVPTAEAFTNYNWRSLMPFPTCEAPHVQSRIIKNFNWAEANTWYDGIRIANIQQPYERNVVAFGPNPIYRRYCKAEAYLTNGHKRPIWYLIEQGMGLAGTGYKVEFCLSGHDPWRVYDGNCRVLRR